MKGNVASHSQCLYLFIHAAENGCKFIAVTYPRTRQVKNDDKLWLYFQIQSILYLWYLWKWHCRFRNCDILPRQRQNGGEVSTVPAQNRAAGFPFHWCNFTGDLDIVSSENRGSYSLMVFMESTLCNVINPHGNRRFGSRSTVFYTVEITVTRVRT